MYLNKNKYKLKFFYKTYKIRIKEKSLLSYGSLAQE